MGSCHRALVGHMVVPQGQHGVKTLRLLERKQADFQGILSSSGDDAHCLVVQLLLGCRIGVHKTSELVEPLVLVGEVV